MNLQDIFNRKTAVLLLIILGVLLAISPAGMRKAGTLSPKEIGNSVINKSDHISAEDLAALIIDKSPDLLLVDLRPAEEYDQFHIEGAVNIPLSQLFERESLDMLSPDYTIVLYSNGGTHSAQAWVLLKQMGIDCYTLLGGLNYWAEAIMNPQPPGDLAADSEILQYQFRKSASGYFNSGGVAAEQDTKEAPAPSEPKKKITRKKKGGDEGC